MNLKEWTKIQRENYAYTTWREADENTSRAARYLGIHRNTLYFLLRSFRLRTQPRESLVNHQEANND